MFVAGQHERDYCPFSSWWYSKWIKVQPIQLTVKFNASLHFQYFPHKINQIHWGKLIMQVWAKVRLNFNYTFILYTEQCKITIDNLNLFQVQVYYFISIFYILYTSIYDDNVIKPSRNMFNIERLRQKIRLLDIHVQRRHYETFVWYVHCELKEKRQDLYNRY